MEGSHINVPRSVIGGSGRSISLAQVNSFAILVNVTAFFFRVVIILVSGCIEHPLLLHRTEYILVVLELATGYS
jgi:hypothetical protein